MSRNSLNKFFEKHDMLIFKIVAIISIVLSLGAFASIFAGNQFIINLSISILGGWAIILSISFVVLIYTSPIGPFGKKYHLF